MATVVNSARTRTFGPELRRPHEAIERTQRSYSNAPVRSFGESSGEHTPRRHTDTPELTTAQKEGCFKYISSRQHIALAFSSLDEAPDADTYGPQWEHVRTKNGVDMYKSQRSRCEVRGKTKVNASVKNVMSLLAAGSGGPETSTSFEHAQKLLIGADQVLDARVLTSCVPEESTSQFFHCGLKYLAVKNPFGGQNLDLVFLDYTDVSTTKDDKLIGYRVIESIRVPSFTPKDKLVRGSIRCEAYTVHETDEPGVVEVVYASHMDPKTKTSHSKRSNWLDQVGVRLANLRKYAEETSLAHHVLMDKAYWTTRKEQRHCTVCDGGFSFLRKRHHCRLCGGLTCGRCSRKMPVIMSEQTKTKVRVCLACLLESRRQPDELKPADLTRRARRGDLANSTWIIRDGDEAMDELEDATREVST